jgi:threonine dehydratase
VGEGAGSGYLSADDLIGSADLEAARAAVAGVAVRTPVIACEELAQATGGPVALKAECLQRSGSFKLRGALAKVAALGASARGGLVTASAGNHARAVALAAGVQEIACEVFMPVDVAVAKLLAVERLGARVHLDGDSVDEALALAESFASADGPAFVHPFDDLDVIAGQATLALELLEEVEDLRRVIVPVGGGGLASGLGIAFRRAGVDVELVGVQASACAPYAAMLADAAAPVHDDAAARITIADGIAVKRPGRLTLPLLRELLGAVEAVSEDEIADAMAFLAETAKLVAEGAGAASVAALLAGRLPAITGTTVAIVSGGNVDGGLLAEVLRRHETVEGRRVRMFTRVRDRPGGLAELLNLIAQARANLVNIDHVREAVPLHVRETGVELTLETRGAAHTQEVLSALSAAGYDVTLE